jgi:hypothetical protein
VDALRARIEIEQHLSVHRIRWSPELDDPSQHRGLLRESIRRPRRVVGRFQPAAHQQPLHPVADRRQRREQRLAGALAGLRHRAQEGVQVFGDHLVQHGVLGVSWTIHGRDTSHASG